MRALVGPLVRPFPRRLVLILVMALAIPLLIPTVARAAVADEVTFVFNTFAFLVWGALVMFMCAGFTMLESGSVRTKNASMICLKNIGLYSIAGLAYFIIGYNLMYVDVGSVIGSFAFLYGPSSDEIDLLAGDEGAVSGVVANGHSTMSDWFFQMVFVATAASIVSGALAERVKMWPFFTFTLLLTAFIYPIVGAWTWGPAAGCLSWDSRTLPARPSCTASAAGRPSPASWSSALGSANTDRMAARGPHRPPTS